MHNVKTFSIIIATFNCEGKIEKTLQSIFAQKAGLFDLTVIDGASTDNTVSIIEKYSDRLTLISEKDGGIYHAFNKGIARTTGRFLYFIGAGDSLKSGVLEKVEELLPDSTTALFYGNCYYEKQQRLYGRVFTPKLFSIDCICQQGIFYGREIFSVMGGFDVKYPVAADWFFNLKCFICSQITTKYVDLAIANYEEGGLSSDLSHDPNFKQDFPGFVKTHLGSREYLRCKAWMIAPFVVNTLYRSNYLWLFQYLLYNYAVPRSLHPTARKLRHAYRTVRTRLSENDYPGESPL